jgi:two-component system cell cycle sensor histidine kinase/response regulator CckA
MIQTIPGALVASALGAAAIHFVATRELLAAPFEMFGIIQLFKFSDFYEVSLGTAVAFLFTAIGWSILLRRKVAEQGAQIRAQFVRENALQRRYQDLFENANDLVFTLDSFGFIVTLNHTGEALLGCPRERAITTKFIAFLNPEQSGGFEVWMKGCAKGQGVPYEAAVTGSQGKRSILELVARPIASSLKFEGLEVIARDITARKSAEVALRQSEERFSSAFRASPVAIGITSFPEGRLLDVNESFVKLFGYDRTEVIDRTVVELGLWVEAESKIRVENALREKSSIGGVECRFRVKSGDERTALVFMEKISTGDSSSILWLSHDVTDRLTLEAQMRHLLKMEAVGRLAAGVAHDFNNLLTVIQGNIAIVLKKYAKEGGMVESLNSVNDAAQRAANLTRQLLTFSRKNNVALSSIDLNLAITQATRMFKHLLRSDISLRINFAANLPAVLGDATMLEQVLMNLVVNARDAIVQAGELRMSTSVISVDRAYKERHAEAIPGEYVCLEVADNGRGMSASTLARIFEPFFTTKQHGEGTGLGLATVYGIVKQHNGWIEVASDVGVGTTFKVFIPTDRSAKLPSLIRDRKGSGGNDILLLEDEPAVLDLMGRLLVDQGHRVLRASSGIEAMQIWTEHMDDIRLLLTDIRLPHGMSGYDVAENLLALNPALKIIFVSGYPSESPQLEQILRQGGLFLAKPCPPVTLNEAVQKMLANSRN